MSIVKPGSSHPAPERPRDQFRGTERSAEDGVRYGARDTAGGSPRWDDLEAFGVIAAGVRAGKTLQQIAEDPTNRIGGARMLYFRLGRLERALGRRLVDRRRWGRTAYLTDAGTTVARMVAELSATRERLVASVRGVDIPVLRLVTHATLASSLIPAVMRRRGSGAGKEPPFHLELMVVASYAGALAAVNDARADFGLYLAFREFDRVPTPRGIRREVLGHTDVILLCPPSHPFATRDRSRRRPVTLEELERESVIARGYVDLQLLPAGSSGRRIIVPHSLDKLTYVRLGLGVSLLPKLIADLSGPLDGVAVLPLRPALHPALTLLRPKKRLRPLGEAIEEFLESVKVSCRAALRAS